MEKYITGKKNGKNGRCNGKVHKSSKNEFEFSEKFIENEIIHFTQNYIKSKIKPLTKNQQLYDQSIDEYQLTVAMGDAGSGKTLLAVKKALEYYYSERVSKIIITRPVIETGESLGFLPGTFDEKMNPYMVPILDSFGKIIGDGPTKYLYKSGKIEICPLAYMRGRNIENAFCILDEAQNTTIDQMKMFLTRICKFSKIVINGDETQSDLKIKSLNGLTYCKEILKDIKEANICLFSGIDIQRSEIVAKIIEKMKLYEEDKNKIR